MNARDATTGQMVRTQSVEERFWSKVDKNGPVPAHCPELGPCWEWTAGKDRNGYGKFVITRPAGTVPREITCKAHRVAWSFENGPLDPETLLLHRCDNPACVRPAHCFPGTQQDNIADRHAKGRDARGDRHRSRTSPETLPRGEAHGMAIISEDDVRAARLLRRTTGLTWPQIAAQLGRPLNAVKMAGSGKTWRHVQ